nr:SHOCT domain-containing protein [Leucobacter manosquensis]
MFESIWDVLACMFWAFVFISALIAALMVIIDLFRDRTLNGWAKAAWALFLVLVPLLTSLVYLVVRGQGMSGRLDDDAQASKEATDAYIREVAGASQADEIAKAKLLLDSGTITSEEFTAMKGRVLNVV